MGTRIEEGSRFYQRHPQWSKMGKMVSDVMDAVTVSHYMKIIDTENIYVAGFALGGTLGLYAAALDTRINGVAAFGAFTPLRLSKKDNKLPGISEYACLHGLQPRLGFFVGHEERLPIDFHEIISSIAPRKVLLVAPRFDQDADIEAIEQYVDYIKKVFSIYKQEQAIDFQKPEYYNQFTKSQFKKLLDWLGSHDK
jgi:esterase/lipase